MRADWRERTRRSSFLLTLCLTLYLGYAVNSGQIVILLQDYRGLYNSAWVGGLMALVITFFLGIAGFFLVKNTLQHDERSGVGQIIASTPIHRTSYLLGKWLSNFALLSTLVAILAAVAVLMQGIYREAPQIDLWALLAPLLLVALPMMALVAALAIFFESVRWLKGGFGNLVYFGVYFGLLLLSVQFPQAPWLDAMGFNALGHSMRAAAAATYPGYNGSFVLSMISDKPIGTFVWNGIDWSAGTIAWRLMWLGAALALTATAALFFNRFDAQPAPRQKFRARALRVFSPPGAAMHTAAAQNIPTANVLQLTPLGEARHIHLNFFPLVWQECLLLVKGTPWYALVGMVVLWLGCALLPSAALRSLAFALAALFPVLIWARMGGREAQAHTGALLFSSVHPVLRLTLPAWLAGVLFTAVLESGVLIGRLAHAECAGLLPWSLSVLFIPTFALCLGTWSRGSKWFEATYPIVWYLGPFNPQSNLAGLDFLGLHERAAVYTHPWAVLCIIALLLLLTGAAKLHQSVE